MKKYILIKADTNDADYVIEKSEITDDIIKIIMPVINAVKEFTVETKSLKIQRYNWWNRESNRNPSPQDLYLKTGKCTEEEFDYFYEFVPPSEHGIHTIESIEILIVQEEIKLL